MNLKAILTLAFFFFILFSLSACGRKSFPEQLEPNGYPHTYPKPTDEIINQ